MSQILSRKPSGRRLNMQGAIAYAMQERKVSAMRLGLEALLMSRGRSGLDGKDYFLHGAWQPGLTWAERRAFIGYAANRALNEALNPVPTPETRALIEDKLATERRFIAAGLPVVPVKAVAAAKDPGSGLRWLDGPEAMLAFLRDPDALPCFGKPVSSSIGIGAVRVESRTPDGMLRLGDGRVVAAEDLVQEIWADWSEGYIFAEIARPHPGMARLIGPVIGTLRVVTVDAGQGPEVLYAVQKCPAKDATVDSAAGPLGSFAAIDLGTGCILREQDRRSLGGVDLAANAVTGVALKGQPVPDLADGLTMARAAHACLGDHGILGMDILLSDRGPMVNEANSNPHHSLYQTGFARGFLNPELLPQLTAVRARYRAVTPRPKLCPLK